MITFGDKTWCEYKCDNKQCARRFSPQLLAEAKHWHGDENPPIAFSTGFRSATCGYTPVQATSLDGMRKHDVVDARWQI
jgi:hypothetical protein